MSRLYFNEFYTIAVGVDFILSRKLVIITITINRKDVEHENCAGDTDCCGIIGKCDKELEQVAGKVGQTLVFHYFKNNATRNSKDFREIIRILG